MYELEKTDEVKRLIEITKSDSKICGPALAKAHMRLGELIGKEILLPPQDTTVVAIMRGGIFFAEGIYFSMGCQFEVYNPKAEPFVRPNTKHVLLVDSVIHSGKTIRDILTPDMKIACCVINENAVEEFQEQLYTIRVSKNSFVGTNIKKQKGNAGPDTTMRLFHQISYDETECQK